MSVVNLAEAVGYVGGLLNTAEWDSVDDASITSTSTTATSATAAFTQADVGKYFSIAGGAGSGKPLIGYIATVTNATTVELSVAAGATLTLARLQYGGKTDDPRHPLWKITQAVLQKDIEVCHAILKTPNHPRINSFTFSANSQRAQTGTGLPVVSHSGNLLMVEIKHTDASWRVGKMLPPELLPKLLTWLNNRSSLFTAASEGYYIVYNGQLYFTGTYIRETYADLSITPNACQAPQEYSGLVSLLAAADLFTTEGDDVSAAGLLAQLGGATLEQLIK